MYLAALILISVSFLCAFSGFSGIQNLVSSFIYQNGTSGDLCLALIYMCLGVSSLTAPFTVAKLGPKECICLQFCIMTGFVACHLAPYPYSMYPASCFLGLGAAPLWVGQGVLTTHYAFEYARLKNKNDHEYLGLFQGIFFGIFQISQVAGNLLSSLVLRMDDNDVDLNSRTTLIIIYLAIMGVGIGVSFLIPDKQETQRTHSNLQRVEVQSKDSFCNLLLRATRFFKNPLYLTILPLQLVNGFEMGFMTSDYNREVVSIVLNKTDIGYVMLCFGVGSGLCSLFVGKLFDKFGPTPFFVFAWLIQVLLALGFSFGLQKSGILKIH